MAWGIGTSLSWLMGNFFFPSSYPPFNRSLFLSLKGVQKWIETNLVLQNIQSKAIEWAMLQTNTSSFQSNLWLVHILIIIQGLQILLRLVPKFLLFHQPNCGNHNCMVFKQFLLIGFQMWGPCDTWLTWVIADFLQPTDILCCYI